MRKRVVITGIGIISPLGLNARTSWNNLIAGKSGVTKLGGDFSKLPCRVAAQIFENAEKFDLRKHFSNSELRTMAPATAIGIIAAKEALEDADWIPEDELSKRITGVAVGMGMIDLTDVCEAYESLKTSYKRVSPFFVPRILPNMAAGNISIKFGFRGPNHSVSTACATGLHAIGDGFRFIRHSNDLSDSLPQLSDTIPQLSDMEAKSAVFEPSVMLCGASEMCISPLSIAAFCRLRALSTSFNDIPEKASRPFDKRRDGFVMGEGSAMLVLEELEHAKKRNAKIYAEILGYGLSGDASHLTAPRVDGSGAFLAMQRALKDAEISAEDVGYINAHATSTPLGDNIELVAIKRLFKNNPTLVISSTKGAHGHLLGSAGNLEAAFTILAIKNANFPPTLNLDEPENGDFNLVPNIPQKWETTRRKIALKNAFGFGGTNASICFAEYID